MGLNWNKEYWNDLSSKEMLQPIIDPNDQIGKKNENINRTHQERLKQLFVKVMKKEQITLFNHILDFGCGIGRNYNLLKSLCKNYTGVDISEGMIKKASSNYQATFLQVKDYTLPFGNNSFDLIFSFWVLQHVIDNADLQLVLENFKNVITTKGIIVICERSSHNKQELNKDTNYINRRPPKEYISLFLKSGFKLIYSEKLTANKKFIDRFKKLHSEGENFYVFMKQ